MKENLNEWISISDMMTGLMMVFLFIAVIFMQRVDEEKRSIEQLAVTYEAYKGELLQDLQREFEGDLARWNAEVLPDLTIRFNDPDVLFDAGSASMKPKFGKILEEFFPRYAAILGNEKNQDRIEEVRIEGHTSSDWEGRRDFEQGYLKNASLSQQRSFAILQSCFSLGAVATQRPWLVKVLRANGLAFANPILHEGAEDPVRSRRVEFKIKTRAEERIYEIIAKIRGGARAS
jgi:chemotaxis protein MotB